MLGTPRQGHSDKCRSFCPIATTQLCSNLQSAAVALQSGISGIIPYRADFDYGHGAPGLNWNANRLWLSQLTSASLNRLSGVCTCASGLRSALAVATQCNASFARSIVMSRIGVSPLTYSGPGRCSSVSYYGLYGRHLSRDGGLVCLVGSARYLSPICLVCLVGSARYLSPV